MKKVWVIFNILTRSLSCLELESASLCHNPSPLPDSGQNYHILTTNEKINALIILNKWDKRYCFPGNWQDASVNASYAKSNWGPWAPAPLPPQLADSAWGCFCHGWKTAQDVHATVLVQCVQHNQVYGILPYCLRVSRLLGNRGGTYLRLVTTRPFPVFFSF